MPPRPVQNIFVSGRPGPSDHQSLTPRTPHSRAGRAEDALTEVELEAIRNDDRDGYVSYRQQQAEPLLASSASSSFPTTGYRSRGDDNPGRSKAGWKRYFTLDFIVHNLTLVLGCLLACILLLLFVVSFTRPGVLDRVILGNKTDTVVEDLAGAPLPSPTFTDTYPSPGLLVSYENYTTFPLTGDQYRHECDKLMGGFMHHMGYWKKPAGGVMDVHHHDDVTNYHLPEGERTKVCTKSITYQLDGQVGLLADLALMAQVAAMARERNRTLFVDDTHWNRGKWLDHFQDIRARQPGPEPGCRAPPPEELVACPRLARHWLVNSRTAKFHLGHAFADNYEDAYAREINRQKPIFTNALESFTQTIRPNAHNAELIRAARTELATSLSHPSSSPNRDTHPDNHTDPAESALAAHHPDPYIAVHIRRGDRKAAQWPHLASYVPLDDYVQATHDTWTRLYAKDPSIDPSHFPSPPMAYVASDSPAAVKDFQSAFSTSTAIFSLTSSTDPALRALASQHDYVQPEFRERPEEERVLLTRGMIVDFAMLSGMWAWEGDVVPGATVCTLSSNVCKLSVVGLGWDRAFGFGDGGDYSNGDINDKRKRWVEIDNKGRVSPVWKAFDLF